MCVEMGFLQDVPWAESERRQHGACSVKQGQEKETSGKLQDDLMHRSKQRLEAWSRVAADVFSPLELILAGLDRTEVFPDEEPCAQCRPLGGCEARKCEDCLLGDCPLRSL